MLVKKIDDKKNKKLRIIQKFMVKKRCVQNQKTFSNYPYVITDTFFCKTNALRKKTKLLNVLKNKNHNWILLFLTNSNKNSIWDLLVKYYEIWPPFQWATSLLTLILIYWISGYFYNKFLAHKGGWMNAKTRIIMIVIDLLFNFSLGIYYMNYRDTFIGELMIQCPVFLSPLFWLVELICFYFYSKYTLSSKKK